MVIPEDTGKEHRRSWRDKLRVSDSDMHDEEGQAGLFTEAKRKAYGNTRTYKTMKNRISLDSPELQAPVHLCRKSGGRIRIIIWLSASGLRKSNSALSP